MRIIIFLLVFAFSKSSAQNTSDYRTVKQKIDQDLIARGRINVDTTVWISKDSKVVSAFLGRVKAKTGTTYYLIKSCLINNLKNSPTAESHVFVYGATKKLVGYYYLPDKTYLPKYLRANKLYFVIKDNHCKNQIIIDFGPGIPKLINLKCEDDNYIEFTSNSYF